MATNDFKPFAIGEYSNVISQDEYENLPAVGAGFTAGIAKSEQLNKVWRQSSVMAAVIGDFIANNSGDDVLDDGDTNKVLLSFVKALSRPIVDASHPVGIVSWFALNKNPNALFPGTTWSYIGENKTIRLAKQDGSDIMKTGGNDSVSLTVSNLPKHSFSVSGQTNEDPGANVTTGDGGVHNHQMGVTGKNSRFGTAGVPSDYGYKGSDNANEVDMPLTNNSPPHNHTVNIPPHAHSFSGQTNEIGDGAEVNIVNSYITLMGWYRTA